MIRGSKGPGRWSPERVFFRPGRPRCRVSPWAADDDGGSLQCEVLLLLVVEVYLTTSESNDVSGRVTGSGLAPVSRYPETANALLVGLCYS